MHRSEENADSADSADTRGTELSQHWKARHWRHPLTSGVLYSKYVHVDGVGLYFEHTLWINLRIHRTRTKHLWWLFTVLKRFFITSELSSFSVTLYSLTFKLWSRAATDLRLQILPLFLCKCKSEGIIKIEPSFQNYSKIKSGTFLWTTM